MLKKLSYVAVMIIALLYGFMAIFTSDSRTVGFLEAYGVLGLLEQIWSTVFYYTSIIYG